MGNLENMTTLELVARIEAKNYRFKVAGFVFAGCLMAGLAVLLVLGLSTLNGVNTQLTQQKTLLNSQKLVLDKISGASKQRTAQINDLQNHIDCIVELFRQPNRQSLTIKDINGCQFDSNGNIITPSGGTNGSEKTNSSPATINNSGGTPSAAPQTVQPTNSVPAQTPAPTQTGVVQRTVNNLFCPLSLANLTCSK